MASSFHIHVSLLFLLRIKHLLSDLDFQPSLWVFVTYSWMIYIKRIYSSQDYEVCGWTVLSMKCYGFCILNCKLLSLSSRNIYTKLHIPRPELQCNCGMKIAKYNKHQLIMQQQRQQNQIITQISIYYRTCHKNLPFSS